MKPEAIALAFCLALAGQSQKPRGTEGVPGNERAADKLTELDWEKDMKRQGIMAAFVEVHFNWYGRPKNLKIIRTMFFSKKDDPDSQITDPVRLGALRQSGLEKELDEEALNRTRGGGWFLEPPRKPVKYGAAYVHLATEEPSRLEPLLFRGYDPRYSELDWAAFLGDAAATRRLLAAGVTRSEASQALGPAAEGDSTLVLRMLLDYGADVNASDKAGETPLTVAAKLGKTAVLRTLLDSGADVSARGEGGDTPLTAAAALDGTTVLKMLLDSGAAVNAGGEGGETPLMVAAKLGKTANVKLLLAAGADAGTRTPGGESALLMAQAYHYREIIDLLERAGAK